MTFQDAESERLNKFLAKNLGVSRREADEIIASGRVFVGEKKAGIGARIYKDDKVYVDGVELMLAEYIYLAFNKPVGYVCSRRCQGDTPTIYELLPEKYQKLKTVGRLDKNSSGLILLTNDGDFAFRMTHPSFVKNKTYFVALDRELEPLHQQMISDFGVNLPDGKSRLGLISQQDRRHFQVNMSEGRNRQIRRTFDALGYKVVELHRTEFGAYNLGELKSGKFVEVSKI